MGSPRYCLILMLFCLTLLLGEHAMSEYACAASPPASGATVESAEAIDKKIDALASKNPQPEILHRMTERSPFVPLFDPAYDWSDQERVHKAISKLFTLPLSAELWERLILHAKDGRYSLTYADEGAGVPENEFEIRGYAENCTVGDICAPAASRILECPIDRSLHILEAGHTWPKGYTPTPSEEFRPVYIPAPSFPEGGILAWRKARTSKAFYELQIEACQDAIDYLPKLKNVSEEAKAKFKAQIEQDIQTLKTTKKGLFDQCSISGVPSTSDYNLYNAEAAQKVRLKYAELHREKKDQKK
jgi:hypothetical protein